MTLLLILIPLMVSFLIGYFLIRLIVGKDKKIDPLLLLFLAFGLGLGVSAAMTFLNFILFNEFNRSFIVGANLSLLLSLIAAHYRREKKIFSGLKSLSREDAALLILLLAASFPLWPYAMLFPYGGWDAWQVWNLKARFLFLGGENWKNMFDPILWRTSPHYPILLPLINVWTWSFLPVPVELGPLVMSMLLTVLTAGLLMAALKPFIPAKFSILAPLLFLTLPFYVKLSISQYSDVILAYFLLAALVCLIRAKIDAEKSYAVLAGSFLGFLSFTKPEGLIASLIVIALAFPYLLWFKNPSLNSKKLIKPFLIAIAIAFIPTILFQLLYSPGNQTFINGLVSLEKPADLDRFKFIWNYFYEELRSEKWHWIWGILTLGLVFSRGKCFNRQIVIIPAFLFAYLTVIMVYYYVNTYFEIEWWMQVTLNRILISLLPTVVFWVFYSLWGEKKDI